MSGGRPETQVVLAALSAASQIALRRHGQSHDRQMEELHSARLGGILDALVTRRVDAIAVGFATVLGQYAEQARHYMAQQEKYADRELDATDPFRRIELRSRINDLDVALATIRAEARLVYGQMTEVVRALGGAGQDFARDFAQPLALPPASMGVIDHDP